MTQPAPTTSPAPAPVEIPDSFFADLAPSARPSDGRALLDNLGHPVPQGVWQPQKILPWYDSIIDDMFANPGCTMKETAARLGRNAVTIGLICRSDLFKARYAQRRADYNAEIQHRLTGKLVKVAEAALDHTLVALEKKKDQVPLPLLREITSDALDRLGYGLVAKRQPSEAPGIVNVNVSAQAAAGAEVQVSAAALAEARDRLRLVEGRVVGSPLPTLGVPDGGCGEEKARRVAGNESSIDGGLDAL